MFELLTDYTLRTVVLGTAGIGAVSGAMGCFAYLRRQSLIGDVVSHSSLLGIIGFFMLSYYVTGEGSKSLVVLIPGAICAGFAALLLTRFVVNRTPLKNDSGLGLMLAIFFGTGLMWLRIIQRQKDVIQNKAGLDDYLFGMAAAMGQDDLWMIGGLGFAAIAILLLFWKEFKVFTFDPLFTQSMGFKTNLLDTLLMLLMVIGIVVGIQAVGVVLMVALLIAPASAARQWTSNLGKMVILAALIGSLSGLIGSVLSSTFSKIPTGPIIVLVATIFFVISIVFAPRRGVLSKLIHRKSLQRESVSLLSGATNSRPVNLETGPDPIRSFEHDS